MNRELYAFNELESRVTAAINKLFIKDEYLFVHDLNERSICHKLACYLQEVFDADKLDVDCEYNKTVDDQNRKTKTIWLLKKHATKLPRKRKKINSKEVDGEEYYETSVYPDIIVHKRGKSECNLLCIEIKKSTNTESRAFDHFKLRAYTDPSRVNDLHYEYGLFIEFLISALPNIKKLQWYKAGKRIL